MTTTRRDVTTGAVLVVLFFLTEYSCFVGSASAGTFRSGTHLLPRPAAAPKPASGQTATPFAVGDTLTVRAYSFRAVGGGHYYTTTTCRLVGENCYIFVEDAIASSSRVTDAALEGLMTAFDTSTRNTPEQGIFDLETGVFGQAPDVDGDPRVLIVVLDILDSGSLTGVSFSGYFDVQNQAAPISREILYVDMNPLDLGSDLAKTTLAHEFQHMIHWQADPDEQKWVDEGCSEYAELLAGFRDTGPEAGSTFLELPNTSLTEWTDQAFDFDQTFLFTTYLAQRAGDDLFPELVSRQENGITGLDLTLEAMGSSLRYADVFADWMAALYLDDEGDRGLEKIEVGPLYVDTLTVELGGYERILRLWGIDYVALKASGGLRVNLNAALDNTLTAVLIGRGANGAYVTRVDLDRGEGITFNSFGDSSRVLAVTRTAGTMENYGVRIYDLAGDSPEASDFDGSGRVAFEDFLLFASAFGRTPAHPEYDSGYDLNSSGKVDFGDFLLFAGSFGSSVP